MLHPDSEGRQNDQPWRGITHLYTIAIMSLALIALMGGQKLRPYLLEGPT